MTDTESTILKAILGSKNPGKAVQLFASIVERIAREYEREQEAMTSEYKKRGIARCYASFLLPYRYEIGGKSNLHSFGEGVVCPSRIDFCTANAFCVFVQ